MPKQMNALELLRADHKKVAALFRRFEKADEAEQQSIAEEAIDSLRSHAEVEEEVFYPFIREATDSLDLAEEAEIEHGVAKDLMGRIEKESGDPLRRFALMKVLGEYVMHHVQEEEERIFPVVEKAGVDLDALGMEIAERKGNGAPDGGAGRKAARGGKSKRGARATAGEEGASEPEPAAGEANEGAGDTTREDEKFLESHGKTLSKTTQRAKWIHAAEEHADRPGQSLATRNHEVIRHWAEERGGKPATSAGGDPERPRVLRFDFPGGSGNLQEVSWDAWFRTFDERDLVFIYQERMKAGNPSNFFRLDSPYREEG